MKYYELYAELYYMSVPNVYNVELNLVKETNKQLQISGAKSYLNRINKSELMQVKTQGGNAYIIYEEGKEQEARKILKAHLEREFNYLQKKAKNYKMILKHL